MPTFAEALPSVVAARAGRPDGRHPFQAFAAMPSHRAVLLVDFRGRVLCQSTEARMLVDLLDVGAAAWRQHLLPRCAGRRMPAERGGEHQSRLLCITSRGLLSAEACEAAATTAGDGGEERSSVLIVNVELREHASAHAARILRERGATPAQIRVGTLLGLGRSKPEIAKDLGIRLSSVEDAVRKLYSRLDVHNAAELGMRIWLHGNEA